VDGFFKQERALEEARGARIKGKLLEGKIQRHSREARPQREIGMNKSNLREPDRAAGVFKKSRNVGAKI
jgi:hypothetical protein